MYLKYLLIIVISTFLCYGCQNSNSADRKASGENAGELEGSVSISGAFALYPLVTVWAEEFTKIHPEVRFNISAGGAGKGMADALAEAVDLGMFSRELKQEEKQKGAWWLAVTKDAVLPTISTDNPAIQPLKEKGLTQEELREIFITGDLQNWGKATEENLDAKITVYTRSDASGAAAVWAEYLGAEGQEALQGVGVFGDPGLADALKKDKNGIGFNNIIYVYDLQTKQKYPGIEVIPIDVDNDGVISDEERFYNNMDEVVAAITDGRYPSPPARDLYFVAKGQPQNPLVQAFLQWVLTDGQQFVEQAGYIKLTEEKIQSESAKLQSPDTTL